MACTVASFVKHIKGCRISDELDEDNDGIVWSDNEIKKCVEESIHYLFALRKDLFSKPKVLTLKKGECLLRACDDCSAITDVIMADGKTCNEIEEKNDEDTKSLKFLSCYLDDCDTKDCYWNNNTEDGYDPISYKRLESSPCTIRFEEPPDRDVEIEVMCAPVDPIKAGLPDSICNDLFSPIVDMTLSRLYLIDHKDSYDLERSNSHYTLFKDFMTLKLGLDYSLIDEDWLLNRQRR